MKTNLHTVPTTVSISSSVDDRMVLDVHRLWFDCKTFCNVASARDLVIVRKETIVYLVTFHSNYDVRGDL